MSTKIPILLASGYWGFSVRTLPYYGFWGMAHESRTDFATLLVSIFLLIVGAGALSIVARLAAVQQKVMEVEVVEPQPGSQLSGLHSSEKLLSCF